MNKKQKNQIAEYLDERWDIYCIEGRNEDLLFYKGITTTIEKLGCSWERFDDGRHIIY